MSWVWANMPTDVSIGARLVLLALADNAGDDTGIAWPSVQTIATKSGLSERQTQTCLRMLEGSGYIIHVGYHQKYGTNVYRMGWHQNGGVQNPQGAENPQIQVKNRTQTINNRQFEQENPEFQVWLDHHEATTGYKQPKVGTKVRSETRSMFDARVSEGYALADLQSATKGAYEDEYRRENGYYDTISVLRPTRIGSLIERGKRKPSPKRGERQHRAVQTDQGVCAKCGTDVTAFQMNNQSRMCDKCYEQFEEGL